jgi:glycosyltransferase involved in cell wall biosynthesis
MLTPQLPYPPDKGTRIRNFGLVKELGRRHEVGVISFAEPADEAARPGLEAYCRVLGLFSRPRRGRLGRAVRTAVDPVPDLARRLESVALTARVAEVLSSEPWDVLQVEALEMAPHWLGQRGAVPAVVLDAHNAEWVLQWRAATTDAGRGQVVGALYSALQAAKLRHYEGRAVDRADATIAVSAADARALVRVGRPRRLVVASNGVDTAALPFRGAQPDGATLLFTGTMDFRPNVDAVVWFVRQVWPRIRAARPDARFAIAGRAPKPEVLALAGDGVEVTGEVPDVAPLFRNATIYVAPLRIGGGVRLKLLEAFAYGVPVVSTSLGAEGIDAVDGRDIAIADRPGAMADRVLALLGDAPRRAGLAAAARQLVEARYDWRTIVPAVEAVYDEIAAARSAGLARSRIGGA